MKAIYTSDLHGKVPLYEDLLALTHSFKAEFVAVGGDLLPSFPPSRRYEEMIPNQHIFIDQFLFPFFERMIDTTTVHQIFIIPGNWDLGYPYLFHRPMEGLTDLCQRVHLFDNGFEIMGYPFVPPTPFRPKDFEKMDDLESPWPPQKSPSYIRSEDQTDLLVPVDPYLYLRQRETIREDLDHLSKPKDPKRTIYVMHSPPLGQRWIKLRREVYGEPIHQKIY